MRSPLLLALAVSACFVLVFFVIGASLDDHWQVQTVRTLAAPHARVQQEVTDLKGWREWSATEVQLGPNGGRTVEGEAGKPGSLIRWQGSQGEATLKLTEVSAQRVAYEFELKGIGVLGTGTVAITPEGSGSRIVWTDRGSLPTLYSRWVAWFGAVQDAVEKQQAASLANLGRRLETAAK